MLVGRLVDVFNDNYRQPRPTGASCILRYASVCVCVCYSGTALTRKLLRKRADGRRCSLLWVSARCRLVNNSSASHTFPHTLYSSGTDTTNAQHPNTPTNTSTATEYPTCTRTYTGTLLCFIASQWNKILPGCVSAVPSPQAQTRCLTLKP